MDTPAPLPERSAVTPDQFREEIVPAGQPVILRGIVADWPLTQAARRSTAEAVDLLKSSATNQPVTISQLPPEARGRFFYQDDMRLLNFSEGRATFARFVDALRAVDDGRTLYMASTPAREAFPSIADMFDLPHVPSDAPPRIFIGNKTVVSTHNDGASNIATTPAGRRTFTLFAPEQVANLYPGPIEHTPAGPQMSMVDIGAPDHDRYPRFEDAWASARQGVLEAGDGIYIPPLWWHDVRAHEDFNILVNYWWRDRPEISREPMEAFVLSLLSVRQLPEAEREAWRAMFDYFVFKTNGAPMDHLPDDYRGVLGPITEARAGQIWEFFQGLVSERGA